MTANTDHWFLIRHSEKEDRPRIKVSYQNVTITLTHDACISAVHTVPRIITIANSMTPQQPIRLVLFDDESLEDVALSELAIPQFNTRHYMFCYHFFMVSMMTQYILLFFAIPFCEIDNRPPISGLLCLLGYLVVRSVRSCGSFRLLTTVSTLCTHAPRGPSVPPFVPVVQMPGVNGVINNGRPCSKLCQHCDVLPHRNTHVGIYPRSPLAQCYNFRHHNISTDRHLSLVGSKHLLLDHGLANSVSLGVIS